jgi:hypothetical protein
MCPATDRAVHRHLHRDTSNKAPAEITHPATPPGAPARSATAPASNSHNGDAITTPCIKATPG